MCKRKPVAEYPHVDHCGVVMANCLLQNQINIKCSFINRHDITQANNRGRTCVKAGVSKCFCTASVSGNYNQTTESYAQAAAMSELVVGGCIVVTRRMTAPVRGSTRDEPC